MIPSLALGRSCNDFYNDSKIIVSSTSNPTPNAGWDYVAYLDPESAQGFGKTPEEAKMNLRYYLDGTY